mgnify:CR=1 FL=1
MYTPYTLNIDICIHKYTPTNTDKHTQNQKWVSASLNTWHQSGNQKTEKQLKEG